mmetsp:Transcript_27524/g.55531  ORF Transcript_27524/g.55531 Transcript_27524/m.55531 type:complete len:80 (-) Transcript_27524:2701-2940(-)
MLPPKQFDAQEVEFPLVRSSFSSIDPSGDPSRRDVSPDIVSCVLRSRTYAAGRNNCAQRATSSHRLRYGVEINGDGVKC